MNRNEVLKILDEITLEDSVSYILDGTISEEDVLRSNIPSSVKEDILCSYKQVLAIRKRIVEKERNKQKKQEIETRIVSDQKEFEKPCKIISDECKFGYQTLEGNILFPIEFEEFIPYGVYYILKYKGKYGCWHYGEKIADYRYDHIIFHKQLNCFQIGEIRRNGEEYWGMMNCKGKILISVSNLNITLIADTRVFVIQSYSGTYKFVTISLDGELEELYFSNNSYELDGIRYYIVKNLLGKHGIVDSNNNILIPVEYEVLQSTSYVWNKQFIAKRGKLYGVVDLYGKIIIPFVYGSIEYKDDEFIISNEGLFGIANKNGQTVLSVNYAQVGKLSHGLRPVSNNSKWGYVDTTEKLIIPFFYDKAGDFWGHYAIVKKGRYYGVIDGNNNTIVPFKYKDIISYESLEAIVVNEFGLEGVIDLKTGNRIPCQYAEIHPISREKSTCMLRCYAYDTSHRYINFYNAPQRRPYIVDVDSSNHPNSYVSIIDNYYKEPISYLPKLDYSTISKLKRRRKGAFIRRSPLAWMRRLFGKSYNIFSSIFAPAEVKRRSHMFVQVYLHLFEETEKVKSLAQESDKNAERRDYTPLQCKLKRGDKVDVQLIIRGEMLLMSDKKSVIWQGSFTKCSFDYFVPKDIDVDELSCVALLTVNDIPVGEMRFITKIVESPRKLNPEIIAHKYNKVFISYAHKDESKVNYFHEGLKLAGIEHFFDRAYLKTGDIFPQVIQDYINSADLFVLFWSENASKSEYVEKERTQALELAFPQVKPQKDAKLSIYPMSIEPRAELPSDMRDNYHFGEI